jgi:L-threonylcarbamoyladenylate synthase
VTTLVTESPEEAASFIRSGGIAAFPTETVYGLGADAFDADAVRKVFEAKGRPADNPLIVHVADAEQIDLVVDTLPGSARALMEHFFPGALTLVLPKSNRIPAIVTAGLQTVGVRMPGLPRTLAFLGACGRPVAAPSANRSGRPSPTTWEAVLDDLDGRIPCVLRGERSRVGLESTVVDCSTGTPVILRAGAISVDLLRGVVSTIEGPRSDTIARSPGMRHRHYAPQAHVVLVRRAPALPSGRPAYIGLEPPLLPDAYRILKTPATKEAYAYELFDFMRRCDAEHVDVIYCQEVDAEGVGLAIMDRLRRAAAAH